jgi:hypothetical protein
MYAAQRGLSYFTQLIYMQTKIFLYDFYAILLSNKYTVARVFLFCCTDMKSYMFVHAVLI